MKNAEKYIDGIASSMVENVVCFAFIPDYEKCDVAELCNHCQLQGKCNNKEKLKQWLNQDAEEC